MMVATLSTNNIFESSWLIPDAHDVILTVAINPASGEVIATVGRISILYITGTSTALVSKLVVDCLLVIQITFETFK